MPLSRRAIQLSPLIFTLAIFLTPCHCWKGSGFKKGSLCTLLYALDVPSMGVSLAWSLLSGGPRLPSSVLSPPCGLNGHLFLMLLPIGNHGWSGPSCYSDNSISLLFGHLSQLSPGAPWTPPWSHQYHQGPHYPPLHPSWHSLSPECSQVHGRCFKCWLGPFKFLTRGRN